MVTFLTEKFGTAAMLVLLMTEKQENSLWCQDIHIKSHENPSFVSVVIRAESANGSNDNTGRHYIYLAA